MRMLIIEDDEKTVGLLRRGFRENGFVVDDCRNGVDGVEWARNQAYDLIVLDVMLPQKDGWSVLSELRAAKSTTPIVMLTAMEAIEYRVKGLTAGADDYVVKPFAFTELMARVRNILRRLPSSPNDDILVYEDLTLDAQRHLVTRAGNTLDLSLKEFMLLQLLLRHQGEVISKTFIIEQVWDVAFDGDNNVVEVNIWRLRAKVDDPHPRKLIHTIRGRGYVIR